MTRRLEGWQRLGVVISICWLVGSCVLVRIHQYRGGKESADAFVALCAGPPIYTPVDQCWQKTMAFRQLAEAPYWPPILFLSIAPIPIFWLFGWATIAVIRWVRAGFVAENG
jgi:hypothetical protein